MPISPDKSRFTACVIGEATSEEQAAFDAALLADASLREEAVTLSRTAYRLGTALKQDPHLNLTTAQRHKVLHQGKAQGLSRNLKSMRPTWLGPTFFSAGIAAVLAVGFYAVPGDGPQEALPSQEAGVSSIALVPSPASKAGSRPVVPPPSAVNPGTQASPMPDAAPPERPTHLERREAMAATPPVIRVIPSPVPSSQGPVKDLSFPGTPLPGKTTPGESLARPAVLPP